MKVINIYLITFILLREIQDTSPTNGYFDGLLKYLKEESKIYQVVFIVHDVQNITDPILLSAITSVNSYISTLIISYNELDEFDLFKPLTQRGRHNHIRNFGHTLFICEMSTLDFDFSNIQLFIDLCDVCYRSYVQQPILILNSASSDYRFVESILSSAWHENFLDVTLLTYSNEQPHKIMKSSSLISPFLSHQNPFTQHVSNELLSSESEWFPKKLNNLNGYRLKVDCKSANVSSTDEYRSSMKLLDILEKTMNFQSNVTQIKDFSIMTFLAKDYKLQNELILTHTLRYSDLTVSLEEKSSWDNYRQNTLVLNIATTNVVIPKGLKFNEGIEVSKEFWYMILATICIIIIIRLTVFLLKFKKRAWQTLSISQIVIGMGTSEEPNNLSERIIFGSLLITCIVYTSYFYSVILDISLHSAPEISTLAELMTSNISVFIVLKDLQYYINILTDTDLHTWLKGGAFYSSGEEETCLKQLANYQNICCVLSDAVYHVRKYEAKYGKLNGKVLQETIFSGQSTFTASYESPFIARIREVILKASEFGFLKDFYKNIPRTLSEIPNPEEITKDKLLPILLSVLVIGYSLSIIVFLLEVITAKIRSRYSRKKPLYRFVN